MAARRELPADIAAAFDRAPEARDRFAALPADQQAAWLDWIDRVAGGLGYSVEEHEVVLTGACADCAA